MTEFTLSEIGEFKNGANFSLEDYGEGYPIINNKQLYSGRYVSLFNLERLKKNVLRSPEKLFLINGDIMFARSSVKAAGAGQVAMVWDVKEKMIFSGFIIRYRIKDKSVVDCHYLNYLLRSPKYKEKFVRIASGTAIFNLSQSLLGNVKVDLPSYAEQKSITSVLGALDDKIENNNRMNETLEEMAYTIYKSWFVEFDPVHAKVAGKAPSHMDIKTSNLFPNSFGEDGLPVGWQYKKLEDISDLSWGDLKTTKKSYVETGFDAYSASGKDGKLPYFDFEKLGIVLSAIGANCGNTWLARGKWSCIKNTIRFWSKYDLTPTIFLYHATKGNNFWPIRGSAQPFISQGDARSQKIIVPANGEAISFEKIVGDFYEKISANEQENQTLAKLRDTLLPKLMSGEISLRDAEHEVEAAL